MREFKMAKLRSAKKRDGDCDDANHKRNTKTQFRGRCKGAFHVPSTLSTMSGGFVRPRGMGLGRGRRPQPPGQPPQHQPQPQPGGAGRGRGQPAPGPVKKAEEPEKAPADILAFYADLVKHQQDRVALLSLSPGN